MPKDPQQALEQRNSINYLTLTSRHLVKLTNRESQHLMVQL